VFMDYWSAVAAIAAFFALFVYPGAIAWPSIMFGQCVSILVPPLPIFDAGMATNGSYMDVLFFIPGVVSWTLVPPLARDAH
jgi:hypothetical protein